MGKIKILTMRSRQNKSTFLTISVFLLLCFSCGHADLDPESFIKNTTNQEVTFYRFDNGNLFGQETIMPDESKFYCICKPVNLGGDSAVFKTALGDSVVYHNKHVANSNFEDTKARSPFVAETWNEFDRNDFEYTILPEDFQ